MIAKDSSNNNFQLKVFGNTQISTSIKKFGIGSAFFDGNGDYLTTSEVSLGTEDFTLECWVFPTILPGQSSIFNQGDSDSTGNFIVNIKSNNKLSLWADNNERYNSTASISLNTWTHLAITRQNDIYYFFINGNLDGTYSGSHNHTGSPFKIGHGYGGIAYFNGYIDDLRITKGVARYTSNFTPPTAELIDPSDPYIDNVSLLLHGDGSDNSLLITDSSNNNFAVALNGDAKISQTEKKFGTGSIVFDGSGDYLIIAPNDAFNFGTSDFTVEFWTYLLAYGSGAAGGQFFGTTNGFQSGWSFNLGESVDRLRLISNLGGSWTDDLIVNSGTGPLLNQWSHLALVRSGNTIRIFVNGQIAAQGTGFSSYNFASNDIIIGRFNDGANIIDLNGYIDDLRITKGVARYTSNFIPPTAPFSNRIVSDTVPTAGLVARFMADQGVTESGGIITSWVDQSGNNITATPFGNPTRIANQMNGRPAVSFNDTQYFSFNLNATIIGPRTYVILGRYRDPTSTSQQGFLAAGFNGNYDRGYVFKNGGEDRAYFYNGAQIRSPNITLAKYHVATVVHNGIPDYNIYRMNGNNSTEISYGSMSVADVNQFVIGCRFPGSETLRGEIVEILIYNRQLSMIEIEQIEKYAKV